MKHNTYSICYIGPDDKKYFYKSYGTKEQVYAAIEKDMDFIELPKKEIIVIELLDQEEKNENNN
jgi:hypothetical protein